MTPIQAGALMRRARLLLRAGEITHHQLAMMDCMVWSCRQPGSDRLSVSYSRLQRLVHAARDTIARGVVRLEAVGLLRKIKQRVKVVWGGGIASRQATNIYVLDTESATPPVFREQEKISYRPAAVLPRKTALEDAIRRLRSRVEATSPVTGRAAPA